MNADTPAHPETPHLLAACWTWAGGAAPGQPGRADSSDILERIRAAAECGWNGLGFNDDDLRTVRDSIGFPALRDALDAHSLDIVEVEFLNDWWLADTGGEDEQLLLDAARALRASVIKAGAPTRDELRRIRPDAVRGRLHALGGRAARAGTRVALEAMGVPGALTITEVVHLLSQAGHPACGAVVDNYHLARVGTTRKELRSLDWSQVLTIELGDGVGEGYGIEERCIPAEGDIGLVDFVRDVTDIGWDGYWGVEIISSQLRALPQPIGVQRVRDGVLTVFDRA